MSCTLRQSITGMGNYKNNCQTILSKWKFLSEIHEDPEKLQHYLTCTMADHDYNLLLGKENSD